MLIKILKHLKPFFAMSVFLCPITIYGQLTVLDYPDANKICCDFSVPSYSIKDTILPIEYGNPNLYKHINVFESSAGLIDSVGFPELPFLMYNFEIPYNAYNIDVSLTDMQYEYYDLDNHILPCQGDLDKTGINNSYQFNINETFYSSDNFFMTLECRLMDTFIIRGVKGVRLAVMPFKYNPYRKQLKVLKSAKIELRYQAGQEIQKQPQSETWENIHSSLFVNHTPSLRAPATENYLILTLPEYEESIQYFANYKQSLGMNVKVHTLAQSQLPSTEIKQIIQDYYDDIETRPDYILLVGDHPNLPAYSGILHDDSIDNPFTDVPYAFLEGEDFYRDALIGRWPVHNSTDVQTITNKTIYMEMNMHLCAKNAVFIAGADNHSINQHYFEQGHEDVIDYAFDPEGYNCTQLNQPERNTALLYLNDDPLFYIYSGHGAVALWAVITSDFPDQWYLNDYFINNSFHKTYPMVFAFACETGNFARAINSISESWINDMNGAVTYFGSSVNTQVLSDYRIEKKLFGDAFYDEKTMGGIIEIGMKRFFDHILTGETVGERYMKSYNLMGDPSFKVRGLGCADSYYVERMKLKSGDVQYYRASETITFDGDNQAGYGSELVLQAGQEIVFKDGFTAAPGSEVTAQIEECVDNRAISNRSENLPNSDVKRKIINVPISESTLYDVKVYPNPTTDILSINIGNLNDKPASIQILDIFGRVMQSVGECLNSDIQLNISHLPSGCYYVVTTIGKEKDYKCIIKQ